MSKSRKDRRYAQKNQPGASSASYSARPLAAHAGKSDWSELRPTTPNVPVRRFALRRWAVAIFCMLAAGWTTWFVCEHYLLPRIPSNLVGKWVVTSGEQEGATFDFYRPGGMIGRINVQGKEGIIDARVRVEGDTLFSTTRNPTTGQYETREQTIVKLTSTELILEDERGQILQLRRAE